MSMRVPIVISGLFALAAALGATPEARADGAVLVLGKATPPEQRAIAESVIAAARDVRWSLTAHALPDKAGAEVAACVRGARSWTCAAPHLGGKGDRLVVVQVGSERTDTVLTVHAVMATGEASASANYFCSTCGDDDALRLAVSDVTRRAVRAAAERSGTTRLAIRSAPDRAWINLDGQTVGSTDAVKITYPGEHTVMLTRAGYAAATRTVEVKEGETQVLSVKLEPATGTVIDPSRDAPPRRSRLVPALLIGVGAVAIAGGAGYSLTVDPPATPEQPKYLYSGPAIGLATAGGALVGIGLYLWLRTPRGSPPRPAPSVSLRPGGGTVGWSTRF